MRAATLSLLAVFVSVAIAQLACGLQTDLVGLTADAARFSAHSIGMMMAVYYVGFSCAAFSGHLTIGRLRHVAAIALALILSAVAISLHPLWVDPWGWTVLRFVSGFAIALIDIAFESWIHDKADNAVRGRLFSVYMVVQIGALTAAQYVFSLGTIGSATLFFVCAAIFVAAILPVWRARTIAPANVPPEPVRLDRLFAISPLGASSVVLAGVTWSMVFTIGPVYAGRVGLDVGGIGFFMALGMGAGALLQYPVGALSDRMGRRPVLGLLFTAALLAAAYGLWASDKGALANYIAAALTGGFAFPIYAIAAARVNDAVAPDARVAVAAGLLLLFGLGSILGPLLCGWAMQILGPAGYYAVLATALGLGAALSRVWK